MIFADCNPFHQILRPDNLSANSGINYNHNGNQRTTIDESVFGVEVPEDRAIIDVFVHNQELREALCQETGCVALCIREDPYCIKQQQLPGEKIYQKE